MKVHTIADTPTNKVKINVVIGQTNKQTSTIVNGPNLSVREQPTTQALEIKQKVTSILFRKQLAASSHNMNLIDNPNKFLKMASCLKWFFKMTKIGKFPAVYSLKEGFTFSSVHYNNFKNLSPQPQLYMS